MLFIFAALTWATLAYTQVIDNLSFGHKQGISSNSFSIPGWSMLGEGYIPQLLSDKVILTPPYGGNKRGALWTEAKSENKGWQATLEFRAGGVDHGKGNLALWYVKSGSDTVSTASIYTVGKFDGLALVIDTNNGVQKIRGFLNDGSTEYRTHANVDGLAFGHCDYNYRNLGRPSKLRIKATSEGFEVLVDDRKCFSTTKVALPSSEYGFGITAASADPPDSFEVFKIEVMSITAVTSSPSGNTGNTPQKVVEHVQRPNQPPSNGDASELAYQTLAQRINTLEKSISNMFTELNRHTAAEESRFNEILSLVRKLPAAGSDSGSPITAGQIGNLESRLLALDRTLSGLGSSLSSEIKSSLNHDAKFDAITQQLQQTHQGLTEHLPSKMREYVVNHTPRIGFIVFSFMAFQSCCLAVLLWQKWRKANMPKKYL